MNSYKRLWIALFLVVAGSFAILGGLGRHIISHAPPIPHQVVTTDGTVLFTGNNITDGHGVFPRQSSRSARSLARSKWCR